ncbi:MAG: ATP-dependent Clp protease proteolytic subunit, partial [Planctomycetaceae bacterium]
MNSGNRRNKSYPGVPHGRPASLGEGTWELAITGDLGEKQSDLLTRIVELPRGSQGILYFDTCGGSVYAGLALATTIRLRGLRATAVVAGECSSAALLPFAACQRRFVTPHSTLLFHPMRWQSDEDVRGVRALKRPRRWLPVHRAGHQTPRSRRGHRGRQPH